MSLLAHGRHSMHSLLSFGHAPKAPFRNAVCDFMPYSHLAYRMFSIASEHFCEVDTLIPVL